MRGIIHVLDNSEDRSAARYALEAAVLQRQAGLSVTLAGPLPDPQAGRRAEREGIAHAPIDIAGKAGARGLADLAGPSVLMIAHSPPAASAARGASKATGAGYVGVVHHAFPLGGLINRYRTAALTQGQLTVAVSAAIADHVRAAGIPHGRLRLLRPAVNRTQFDPGAVTAARVVALAEQWRLSDGAAMVLVPGLTARHPRTRVLFDALGLVGHPDLRCVIVPPLEADPVEREALDDLAVRTGATAFVHVVERCDDMPAAYMLADAVATLPPWDVGFDWVAAEAQALGRPLVGFDSASLRELTVPRRTAWLVEAPKPAALAEALTRALALDTPSREALASAARENIDRVCDRRRFASGLAGLVRDLTEGQLEEIDASADVRA